MGCTVTTPSDQITNVWHGISEGGREKKPNFKTWENGVLTGNCETTDKSLWGPSILSDQGRPLCSSAAEHLP